MFSCDKCGLCCMHIDESNVEPRMNRGDGVCRFFDEDTHLCNIYDKRPIFCNVDRFYEEHLTTKILREDYYEVNCKSCKILKERYGG